MVPVALWLAMSRIFLNWKFSRLSTGARCIVVLILHMQNVPKTISKMLPEVDYGTYWLPLKTFTYQIWFHLVDQFARCAEICAETCASIRGRGVEPLWTYLLPFKTSTCQIRFHLLGLFLSCAEMYVSFVLDPSSPEEGGVSNYHRNLYRDQKPLHRNFHVDRFGSFRAYMDQTD